MLLTEKLVAVIFAHGQRRFVFGRQTVELQALLVQVITVGNLPIELGFTRFQTFRRKREGFLDREKIGFCVKRISPCLGQARDQESEK
ncbi:hypothetical protein D3C86_1849810 [compost metagenome]